MASAVRALSFGPQFRPNFHANCLFFRALARRFPRSFETTDGPERPVRQGKAGGVSRNSRTLFRAVNPQITPNQEKTIRRLLRNRQRLTGLVSTMVSTVSGTLETAVRSQVRTESTASRLMQLGRVLGAKSVDKWG